jgi:hypothetical protein
VSVPLKEDEYGELCPAQTWAVPVICAAQKNGCKVSAAITNRMEKARFFMMKNLVVSECLF